jgi:DNA-binding response OmpR family regulator
LIDIIRTLGIFSVEGVRDRDGVIHKLEEQNSTVLFVEWSEYSTIPPLEICREIRSLPFDRLRRIPIIAMSSQLTRDMVIQGRAAGIDEFMKKPCSPKDVETRLKMVVETPRPFIDSKVYVGPCRRRKNPADYHGPKRRGEDVDVAAVDLSDAEQQLIDETSPMGLELSRLKVACKLLSNQQSDPYKIVLPLLKRLHQLAKSSDDKSMVMALSAFETFILATLNSDGDFEACAGIVTTGITTLEQLIVLPRQYESARVTVSNAYSSAINRRLAL